MTRILNSIINVLLVLPVAVRATAKCYARDGTSNSDIPCSSNGDVSACCGTSGPVCYSNGMCGPATGAGNRQFGVGGCTDSTWNSTACLSVCPDRKSCVVDLMQSELTWRVEHLDGGGQALYMCTDDGGFCCGQSNDCCSGTLINLGALHAVSTINPSQTNTPAPSASAASMKLVTTTAIVNAVVSVTVASAAISPSQILNTGSISSTSISSQASSPTIIYNSAISRTANSTIPTSTPTPTPQASYPGTIVIDTNTPLAPSSTTYPPPIISAPQEPTPPPSSTRLLKIILPVIVFLALTISTAIFIFFIRKKYSIPEDDDLSDDWPELKGETEARFSFLSVLSKKQPPIEPHPLDRPGYRFSPQELEGSQVSLV